MLDCKRQNIHHSKLPKPGQIGWIVGLERSGINPRRKCIISHYPLCDNALPYSRGIHTVFVKFLDNGEIARFSGIWFAEETG